MAVSRSRLKPSSDELFLLTDRIKNRTGQGSAAAARDAAALIDHTLLKAEATPADIKRLCREARTHRFCSVCVNTAYVKLARSLLRGTKVKVCGVVGFPLGAMHPRAKAWEAAQAIRDGAQEIDMVLPVGALKAGEDAAVLADIRGVVKTCRRGRARCKVILETCLLSQAEKIRACRLCLRAGADFVKTSTGFSTGGATAEDIALMARTVAPGNLGVKASGGIRTYDDLVKMVQAGATRVGCSSSVRIVQEAKGKLSETPAGRGY